MAFQTKNFSGIVGGMIRFMSAFSSRVTDFTVGSVNRTMLEAVAIELEQFYIQLVQGLTEAIETAVFRAFEFPLLAPAKASGQVTFFTTPPAVAPIVIPVGTQVQVPNANKIYETLSEATIGIGETEVTVLVAATSPGVTFNTSAGTVTQLVTPVAGVTSLVNPISFINGTDVETEFQRRARFREFILTLARSHKEGVAFGAKTAVVTDLNGIVIESVKQVLVYEQFQDDPTSPSGVFTLFIYNGQGGTSQALIDATTAIIEGFFDLSGARVNGYKAAGVQFCVKKANEVTIPVTAQITLSDGFILSEVIAAVEANISAFFPTLGIGDDVIYTALLCVVKDTPGVSDVTFTTPLVNISINFDSIAIQGTTTIT